MSFYFDPYSKIGLIRCCPAFRVNMGRITLPDGRWWLSGGNLNSVYLDTSIIFPDTPGPTLPLASSHHCKVQLNSTHILVAGGHNGAFLKTAHILEWDTETWTPVTDSPIEIYLCFKAGEHAYFTGRNWDEGKLARFKNDDQSWITLENRSILRSPSFVTFGNSVLMVGGYLRPPDNVHVDTIYEFDLGSEDWVLRPERLREIRSGFSIYEMNIQL